MRLVGTVAATLFLAVPALAEDEGATEVTPAYEYAAPLASKEFSAKDSPSPGERQAPRPAPSGCPFRDGKLELIV